MIPVIFYIFTVFKIQFRPYFEKKSGVAFLKIIQDKEFLFCMAHLANTCWANAIFFNFQILFTLFIHRCRETWEGESSKPVWCHMQYNEKKWKQKKKSFFYFYDLVIIRDSTSVQFANSSSINYYSTYYCWLLIYTFLYHYYSKMTFFKNSLFLLNSKVSIYCSSKQL